MNTLKDNELWRFNWAFFFLKQAKAVWFLVIMNKTDASSYQVIKRHPFEMSGMLSGISLPTKLRQRFEWKKQQMLAPDWIQTSTHETARLCEWHPSAPKQS